VSATCQLSSPDALTANSRKAPAPSVHDTHGQFSKLPRLSPAELSRMKSEKEAQDIAFPTKNGRGSATAVTPTHGKWHGGPAPCT
jgi:hypothetical protein